MDWQSEGYILSVRSHGETSAIVKAFTKEHGVHAGLVRGGRSRRMRPVLQAGNKVSLEWHARLSEHLGIFSIEAINLQAALIMEDRLALAAINAVSAVTIEALPEREAHANLFTAFEILLEHLNDINIWPALYVRYEIALLQALGYGLDLKTCAATGGNEYLTHVSPRSGRAVCASSAEPYLDKLLALPGFLRGENTVAPDDIAKGLKLSGYFLTSRIFYTFNKDIPQARYRLLETLKNADII
ncbi:MAG: DNA repair protein RecO [Robiginitomaculum sp.]